MNCAGIISSSLVISALNLALFPGSCEGIKWFSCHELEGISAVSKLNLEDLSLTECIYCISCKGLLIWGEEFI